MAISMAEADEKGKKVVGKSRGCKILKTSVVDFGLILRYFCCGNMNKTWKEFMKIVISFLLALGCLYILRYWNEEARSIWKFIKDWIWGQLANLSKLLIVSDNESQLEEDELLAKALQESWNVESPPRSPPPQSPPHQSPPPQSPPPRSPQYDYASFVPHYPFYYPSGYR